MTSGGGGFFNRFTPWGRGGGRGGPGGHQGGGPPGRGDYHPRLQGPGGGRRGVSFEDSADYDFADDDRNLYGEGQYPPRRTFNDAEYEARRNSIFLPDGVPPTTNDTRRSMHPPETAWHEHTQGQQGHQGQLHITGPPGGEQNPMPAGVATPQAMAAPQGGVQTAVTHHPHNHGGGA